MSQPIQILGIAGSLRRVHHTIAPHCGKPWPLCLKMRRSTLLNSMESRASIRTRNKIHSKGDRVKAAHPSGRRHSDRDAGVATIHPGCVEERHRLGIENIWDSACNGKPVAVMGVRLERSARPGRNTSR